MKGALLATAIIVAFFSTVAGLALETKLIPDSEIQKLRVPMSTVFYGSLPTPPVRTRTPDFTLTWFSEETWLAKGRDKKNRAWRIVLPPANGLWFTGNGRGRTYYFAGYTGGAGMAPDSWILAVSFDEGARPIPFYIVSHAAYDEKGIKDLLQIGAESPILLQQTWVETKPAQRYGYFITSAYQQHGVFWYETNTSHGSIRFPAFELWVGLPDSTPVSVSTPELPNGFSTDFGNDPNSGIQTRIVGADEHGIRTRPELGCRLDFINVVVLDSAHGRDIEVLDVTSLGMLLPAIVRYHAATTFTGLTRWPDACTGSIAWAHF